MSLDAPRYKYRRIQARLIQHSCQSRRCVKYTNRITVHPFVAFVYHFKWASTQSNQQKFSFAFCRSKYLPKQKPRHKFYIVFFIWILVFLRKWSDSLMTNSAHKRRHGGGGRKGQLLRSLARPDPLKSCKSGAKMFFYGGRDRSYSHTPDEYL